MQLNPCEVICLIISLLISFIIFSITLIVHCDIFAMHYINILQLLSQYLISPFTSVCKHMLVFLLVILNLKMTVGGSKPCSFFKFTFVVKLFINLPNFFLGKTWQVFLSFHDHLPLGADHSAKRNFYHQPWMLQNINWF